MPGRPGRSANSRVAVHPFDLIIFDFDGTLADSAPGICACMAAAFNSFGLPGPTMADVRPTIGLTLEESIRQLTARHGRVDITAVARAYRDLHETVAAPAISLFAGAADVLAAASVSGIGLALVSQKAQRTLHQLLVQLEIERHFDLVLGSDTVTATKPDPALYERHVAPQFPGLTTQRVLMVGDTATDLGFAVNIGAASCWAEYGYGNDRCLELRPTFRVSTILGVADVCGFGAA